MCYTLNEFFILKLDIFSNSGSFSLCLKCLLISKGRTTQKSIKYIHKT